MEEMMMVMMKKKMRSQESCPNTNMNSDDHKPNIPIITTTTSPTWKLYENPFYIFHQQQNHQDYSTTTTNDDHDQDRSKQIHRLHLPISARKIAASFLDLAFIKPLMESSELESGRAQITQLKAELEGERRARRKMESLSKRAARELSEERRRREALEHVCEELAKEISAGKAEMGRVRREMEEERKMLRTAEVIREERVQMKLSEAKIFMEEKLSEMEKLNEDVGLKQQQNLDNSNHDNPPTFMAGLMQRRITCGSGERENPHIKRGIRGFVEFPRVVRAIGCRSSSSSKHVGSKLECQKAQLKILLKQKGSVRFNSLIAR